MGYYVNKKTKLSRGVKNVLIDFSENTTAHGIPRLGRARTKRARIFWIFVCLICSVAFAWLAFQLILKYLRFEKITQIELQFKNAPFPAVTLCNLNPYKKSLAKGIPELNRVITSFEGIQSRLDVESQPTLIGKRTKRIPITYEYRYMPVYAFCRCPRKEGNSECLPFFDAQPRDKDSQCVCFYDRVTQTPFRCFPVTFWSLRWCTRCEIAGNCPPADINKLEEDAAGNVDDAYKYIAPCVCQNVTNYCIATGDKPFGRLWLISTAKPPPIAPFVAETTTVQPTTYGPRATTEYPLIEESAKDVGTQSSQAQESMLFAAASMSNAEVKAISHKLDEFVLSCTFNQRDCDLQRDFRTFIDPKYGSCYVFNADSTQNRTSPRAGPMYGLSILLYVNASEYLPMIPGKGVRIAVHNQTEYPFPDTFGYNAPTGFLTSFGIKLKTIQRIPWPRDECVKDGRTEDYIFTNYSYSVEGCFRSCLQKILVNACSCADPLFPTLRNSVHCRLNESVGRKCINRTKTELGGLHGDLENSKYADLCGKCIQPCEQIVFDVAFSTALWPHSSSIASYYKFCESTSESCEDQLRRNAVFLEIYYEQLNYESLIESQAYLLANLLADLGGQLGLWLGFSVITCFEFIFLVWDLMRLCYSVRREKKKHSRRTSSINGDLFDKSTVSLTLKLGGPEVKFGDDRDNVIEIEPNENEDNYDNEHVIEMEPDMDVEFTIGEPASSDADYTANFTLGSTKIDE